MGVAGSACGIGAVVCVRPVFCCCLPVASTRVTNDTSPRCLRISDVITNYTSHSRNYRQLQISVQNYAELQEMRA